MNLIGRAPRGALFTFAALALGLLLAACGSASSSSTSANAGSSGTTTTTAAAGAPNSAQRTKLVACLKQHGVTLPARPAGAPGGPPAGGGTGTTGTGTGTTGTGGPPRGFFGGGGRFADNPKLRAAFQACGAQFGFRAGAGGAFRRRLSRTNITKYVTCVRQHGYNLPSPNFSGKGPIFPANIRSNAKFQAASRACQSLLVPPRPSGTSTTAGA